MEERSLKKIACIVSNDLSFDQRMIRVCTALSNAGFEVTLIGRVLPESIALVERSFLQKRIRMSFHKGKLFYLELNLRYFFLLLKADYDIIYAVDLDTLIAGRLSAWLRSKTCVYDAHEYFTEVPELIERPLSKKIWELAARALIPGIRHAITVCDSLASIFKEKYRVNFDVIRNVPFSQKSTPRKFPDRKPFILLYQGALNDGRGLEEAIEAVSQLDDVVLWICGEGDLSATLRELVAAKGLKASVQFFGKLQPAQLTEITSQADLGLNLLKNKGLNYYYSLANKAFDYIQAGLPSIGMAFPEYQNLNAKYDVFCLVDELKPSSIAAAVNLFRLDRQYYERCSENCIRAAKELNWEIESKKLVGIFTKLGKPSV